MTDMVIAVFDTESSTRADTVGWDASRVGFACGVVRFEHFRRGPKGVSRRTLHENVYWNPAAMVSDLLHPRVHACVSFNGRRFDVPLLAHAVVPPAAGPYLATSSSAEVVACTRAMRSAQVRGAPLVRFEGPVDVAGAPWWARLGADVLGWLGWRGTPGGRPLERAVGRWMALRGHHDQVYPAGAAGLRWRTAERLQEALTAKTLDPLHELGQLVGGHTHLLRMRSLVEGLSQPLPAPDVDHADLPAWWQDGREWEVIGVCRSDVAALVEVLHVALDARALMASTLSSTVGSDVDLTPVVSPSWGAGGLHRYRFDTTTWWSKLTEIAAEGRQETHP